MRVSEDSVRILFFNDGGQSFYVPKHYTSQPALAFSSMWPEIGLRPSSSQSNYGKAG